MHWYQLKANQDETKCLVYLAKEELLDNFECWDWWDEWTDCRGLHKAQGGVLYIIPADIPTQARSQLIAERQRSIAQLTAELADLTQNFEEETHG